MRKSKILDISVFLAYLLLLFIGAHKLDAQDHSVLYSHEDKKLQRRYQELDDYYFDGKLPEHVTVIWFDIPMEQGAYVMGDMKTDINGSRFDIRIDTKSNVSKATEELTLFHEICHVAVFNQVKKYGEDSHGPHFQACMMNLAAEGAFADLW